jgi:hypothetical protein
MNFSLCDLLLYGDLRTLGRAPCWRYCDAQIVCSVQAQPMVARVCVASLVLVLYASVSPGGAAVSPAERGAWGASVFVLLRSLIWRWASQLLWWICSTPPVELPGRLRCPDGLYLVPHGCTAVRLQARRVRCVAQVPDVNGRPVLAAVDGRDVRNVA